MSYSKIGKLGSGAYGKVYLSKNDKNFNYAIKINTAPKTIGGTIGCLRELHFLKLFRGHPYIINLEDVVLGNPFINGGPSPMTPRKKSEGVIKLDKERSLDRAALVLERGAYDGIKFIKKKYPLEKRILFAVHLLLGVEFLHSRGVYHRDLKPSNIICFLDENKEFMTAKITDFGLTQYYCPNNASEGGYITPWYRPPEISLFKDYDYGVDVWSLGCIMYELFSDDHSPPFPYEEDSKLINSIIEKLPFPLEDYNLARALYKNEITPEYYALQSSLKPLEIQNKELRDPIEGALQCDTTKRLTVSDLLNMPWTAPHARLIAKVRGSFGINRNGQWVLSPLSGSFLISQDVCDVARDHLRFIIKNRNEAPIISWYTHEIAFHILEIFSRIHENFSLIPDETPLWINTIAFILVKYFAIFDSSCLQLKYFNFGIKKMSPTLFTNCITYLEEKILVNVCHYEIFRYTFYEISPEVYSDMELEDLLLSAIDGKTLTLQNICNPQK